jgi:hypothetical protein
MSEKKELEDKCLKCHAQDQVPNELIYKRYLVKYSTQDAMKQVILKYLKDPRKENSVMPPPFFLKFPMKKALEMNDVMLERNTRAFLKTFDMKKKLILPR